MLPEAGREGCLWLPAAPAWGGGWAPWARSGLAGGFLGSQAGFGSGGDWPSVPPRQDQDLRKEREWVSGGLWGRPLMQPRQGWPPCRRRRDALPEPRSQMEGGQAVEEPPAPASRRGVSRPQPRTQGPSQHHPFPWPPVFQAISRAATVWKHFLVFSNSVLLKKAFLPPLQKYDRKPQASVPWPFWEHCIQLPVRWPGCPPAVRVPETL